MFDDFGSIVEIEYPAVFDTKPRMDSAQVTFRKPHEARRPHRRTKGFQMWGKDVITSLERFPETAPAKDVKLVEEVESVPAEVVTSEMLEEDSGIQQDIKDERVSGRVGGGGNSEECRGDRGSGVSSLESSNY